MTTEGVFTVDEPALRALLDVLGKCGQVVSVFMKPRPRVDPGSLDSDALKPFFECRAFYANGDELGGVAGDIGRFAILNRLEFEGSLVSVVLKGGCHHATRDISLDSARSLVINALASIFPKPFSDITVFRMDDQRWCHLTADANISSSYVVWEGTRGLWWILCVADFD